MSKGIDIYAQFETDMSPEPYSKTPNLPDSGHFSMDKEGQNTQENRECE